MPNIPSRPSNMPPVSAQPAAGTQTSDRYGNVISTRPAPAPEVPVSAPAPTSDRWGHILSTPPGYVENPRHIPIPGTNFVPGHDDKSVNWK